MGGGYFFICYIRVGLGGVRLGKVICEIMLSGVCVGDLCSLSVVEYFYLYNLYIVNILLQK